MDGLVRTLLIAGGVSLTSCSGYIVIPPPSPRAVVVTRTGDGQEIGIGFFYDRLSVHGDWVRHSRYGWVWIPSRVPYGWRPYTHGYWAYTDGDDWLWVSEWEWGWAPFHYGRWYFDDHFGWAWIPGYVWAPAWVAWRRGGGYVGWAALGPRFEWDVTVGYRWYDATVLAPPIWVFVYERHFLSPNLRSRLAAVARNASIVERTRTVTDVTNRRGRPADRGVSRGDVETALGRTIVPTRVRTVTSPFGIGARRPAPGEVLVFQPRVRRTPPDREPPAIDAIDRRQQIEREELNERHRVILQELQNRYRRPTPLDRATATRRDRERRAIDLQIQRERRALEERQARERRKIIRRPRQD